MKQSILSRIEDLENILDYDRPLTAIELERLEAWLINCPDFAEWGIEYLQKHCRGYIKDVINGLITKPLFDDVRALYEHERFGKSADDIAV